MFAIENHAHASGTRVRHTRHAHVCWQARPGDLCPKQTLDEYITEYTVCMGWACMSECMGVRKHEWAWLVVWLVSLVWLLVWLLVCLVD